MKPLPLLIANTLSLLVTLVINYSAGSGALSGKSVGEVSSKYPTLVTPAGYAFSIWGFIYLLLIAFTVYQWLDWRKGRNEDSLNKAGIWFFLANMANALWVIVWVHEALGWSVLIIFLLLFSLVKLIVRLELEIWDAPLRIIAFVWWPVCIYAGWVILATITNVAVFLKSTGFPQAGLSSEVWAIIALTPGLLIYLFLIRVRNMREAALAGVWGLVAIAVRHWDNHEVVVVFSLLAAAVLFAFVAYHGVQNKDTSPFMKWKKRHKKTEG